MRKVIIFVLSGMFIWAGCTRQPENYEAVLPSPRSGVQVYFNLFRGAPYYLVFFDRERILNWSLLGFVPPESPLLTENMLFAGRVEDKAPDQAGETGFFNGLKYNSLSVSLVSGSDPEMGYIIDFRAFEGGMAFRYRFDNNLLISSLAGYEHSELNLNDQGQSWSPAASADTLVASADASDGPAVFDSDGQKRLQLLGLIDGKPVNLSVEEGSSASAFLVRNDNLSKNEQGAGGKFATPWRILLISNNLKDEQ